MCIRDSSYAELRLCDAVGGAKVLELSFTWLKDAGRDSVSGYTEDVYQRQR